MSSRLPVPGSDDNTWGTILNEFLEVEHNADGTLKIRTDGTIPTALAQLTTDVDITNPADGQVLSYNGASSQWTNQVNLTSALALKAPLASPTFTGAPTAPTQTTGDNSTKIATDAFVTTAVNAALGVATSGGLLSLAPTGATAETFSRIYAYSFANELPSSAILYVRAIYIPQGTAINNISFFVGNTLESGGSHGWYCLLDSNLVVRAVSADQTGATVWGTAQTVVTLSVAGSNYTTTYSGLYYVGVCIVASTHMPTFLCGASSDTSLTNLPPILMGSSSTGLSTPPATGTTMSALTGNSLWDFYAYTS